jgi:hypothetical protein
LEVRTGFEQELWAAICSLASDSREGGHDTLENRALSGLSASNVPPHPPNVTMAGVISELTGPANKSLFWYHGTRSVVTT